MSIVRELDRRLRKVEGAIAQLDLDRPTRGPVEPRPAAILGDLTATLAHEASRLAELARRGPLSRRDRRALVDFARALATVSAEDERMRRADAVASMTDEQLRELAAKLISEVAA